MCHLERARRKKYEDRDEKGETVARTKKTRKWDEGPTVARTKKTRKTLPAQH